MRDNCFKVKCLCSNGPFHEGETYYAAIEDTRIYRSVKIWTKKERDDNSYLILSVDVLGTSISSPIFEKTDIAQNI